MAVYALLVVNLCMNYRAVRNSVRSTPLDQCEVIRVDKGAFENMLIEENEMEMGGKMYDIVHISRDSDQYNIYCLADPYEDHWLDLVDDLLHHSENDRQQLRVVMLFCAPSVEHSNFNPSLVNSFQLIQNCTPYVSTIKEITRAIKSPPPRS